MSRRVTMQTEIKDRTLAVQAIKQAGMSYEEMGDAILITSGPISGATIDLRSGVISGSSDVGHSRGNDSLGILKRFYVEAKFTQECALQGVMIQERVPNKDGSIRLRCKVA